LIIFDLDDTLISTSKTIIPKVLQKTLLRMIAEGLYINDSRKALKLLLMLNKQLLNSKEALKEFVRRIKAENFLNSGLEELDKLPLDIKVKTTSVRANKILQKLSEEHKLSLVSRGKEDMQMEKIRRAGIDISLFSHIMIVSDYKEEAYKQIVDKEGCMPYEVVVIGDRPLNDLVPAKKLGYNTIHFKNGRGADIMDEVGVDFQIISLEEVLNKIEDIKRVKRYANN
jgi:FMN phosphatase YigB (HAD superfamily)